MNAYESLIYDAFLENEGRIGIEDIIKLAERKFYLTNLSRLLIIKVLKKLEEEGKIIKKDNIYVIEDNFFAKIKENYKNNKNNYENFIKYIISCVNNMVDPQLTITENKMVESFLQRTLFEIFNRYTDNVVEIYGGKVSFIPLPQLEDVMNEIFEESVAEKSERELLIQDAFLRTLKKLFYHPTEVFSTGLRIIANRHLLYKIIVKNPPTEKITLDIFKKVRLFIDTNILISYLCKESQMHDITNSLLKESRKLGAQIFLSNWTEREFRNTLNHAKHLLDISRRKKIKPEIFENEILQTFLRRKDEKEWIGFLKELSLAFSIMEKEGIIPKKKCKDEDVASEIDNVEKVIKKGLRELGVERHPSLILHDAKMITYVQNVREEKTLSIGTVWFLTRDYRLKEIEKRYINELGYKFESAITPDIWFEIILPFISADVKEKDISIAFSKIIASAILPLPFDIVEQFLSYLEASLDLPKEEENILKGMIEALKEKKHIILIEWRDIEEIKNGEDWINILKRRYYLPQKLALSMP